MMGTGRRLLMHSVTERVSSKLRQALGSAGFRWIEMPWPELLNAATPDDVIVLETGDDIAALTQFVYHLYDKTTRETAVPVIALVSQDALRRNPRLGGWTVNGHAAVIAVTPYDTSGFLDGLVELLARLCQPSS